MIRILILSLSVLMSNVVHAEEGQIVVGTIDYIGVCRGEETSGWAAINSADSSVYYCLKMQIPGLDQKTNYLLTVTLSSYLEKAREAKAPKYLIMKGSLSKQSQPNEQQTIYVKEIVHYPN